MLQAWIALSLAVFILLSQQCPAQADDNQTANGSIRNEVTWDYVVESAYHGFNSTLLLTKSYGKDNLTPAFDVKHGASDWLFPSLLQDSLCMYKITRNDTYLKYARIGADSINKHMLNDNGIIRMYSYRKNASDTEPTDLNYYLLPAIAELAIYDPSYKPLAKKVAYGIVNYGLSKNDLPYGAIYPNGTVAQTGSGLPSNGGMAGTVPLTAVGLLRAYQATGDSIFLNKSRDILISVWNNKRTKYSLVPTTFDTVSLITKNNNTQLYATGELLAAYNYYYYLTQDPAIRRIILNYSTAAYNSYWSRTDDGQGFFAYRVDVAKGRPVLPLLETNWHKLDMSLIYAGDISGLNYSQRIYQDMDTYWLGRGLAYINHLFRHGTKTDGSSGYNKQSLICASFRTAIYVMLRMLNQGAFNASNAIWNDKVWEHIGAVRAHHYHKYGYHTDIDVGTFEPDAQYYGLTVISACDEFSSLAALIFRTTPNIKMEWEIFPKGNYSLEPFSTIYSNDVAFMDDTYMNYSRREIAFKKITSKGEGKIYCSQNLSEVMLDGFLYWDWWGKTVNIPEGSHECVFVFKGGNYIRPTYLN